MYHGRVTQIDATKLLPGLYQGSAPESVTAVRAAGFDLLVLCAIELQLTSQQLRGMPYVRCPLVDNNQLSERQWIRACRAATQVAGAVRAGAKVLVTCAEGRNRSGLVCAIAICRTLDAPGKVVVRHIRSRRANALTNPAFVRALEHHFR